jgi:threonine dehydrogenase-like Zn-dependent dehydrogenase
MKAAITDGKGGVWLAETPVPEPNEYQCLCKMLACATCTGTDQKHLHNTLPWAQDYPGVLGHESVGQVIRRGAKVTQFAVGDLVLRPTAVYPGERLGDYTSLWGGFAEYGLVTDGPAFLADHPTARPSNYTRFQQKLPSSPLLSPADATMLITLKETASYVASVGVRLSSTLVILGSGAVALSMCRFAKIFGAYPVIVVGRRDEPLAYAVERIGADFTINVRDEDLVGGVRAITGGQGVEFVIDTTGDAEFLRDALPVLSATGKAAAYATYPSPDTIPQTIAPAKLVVGRTGEDVAHQYLLDAVRLGLVTLADFYSHRLPFHQVQEGFALLRSKRAFKVVFEMEGGG